MKIGLLFAGQGSQYVGMGKDIYEKYDSAKKVYDNVELDFDIKDLCFNGPSEKLNDTAYAQSSILVTSMAIASVLKENNIEASYVAGLSLGEYSALCYANAFSINDAAKVVRERGKIMANALPIGTTTMMAVLNTDIDIIKEVCNEVKGVCEIANYNCPGQIVITGEKNTLEEAKEKLLLRGARRVVELNVSGAFHSSLLESASLELKEVLEGIKINKPEIPVIYNISGKEEDMNIIDILTKQIKSSVYFMQSISYMLDNGVNTFIEIGPGSSLKNFVKKINSDVTIYSLDKVEDIEKLLEEIKQWKRK